MSQSYTSKHIHFELKDGILYGKYLVKDLNLDIVKTIVRDRIMFTGEINVPTLVEAGALKSINKEAREFYNSPQGTEYLTACAFFTESKFAVFLGNFLSNFSFKGNKVPFKMFSDKAKALKWLQSYIVNIK